MKKRKQHFQLTCVCNHNLQKKFSEGVSSTGCECYLEEKIGKKAKEFDVKILDVS